MTTTQTLEQGYTLETKKVDADLNCEYLHCGSETKERNEIILYDDNDDEVESSIACGDCTADAKDTVIAGIPIPDEDL